MHRASGGISSTRRSTTATRARSPSPRAKHPYHYMTDNEKHWRNVLVRERRIAKKAGGWDKVGAAHLGQAKQAKRHLRQSKRLIEAGAKKNGWKHNSTAIVRHRYIKKLLQG